MIFRIAGLKPNPLGYTRPTVTDLEAKFGTPPSWAWIAADASSEYVDLIQMERGLSRIAEAPSWTPQQHWRGVNAGKLPGTPIWKPMPEVAPRMYSPARKRPRPGMHSRLPGRSADWSLDVHVAFGMIQRAQVSRNERKSLNLLWAEVIRQISRPRTNAAEQWADVQAVCRFIPSQLRVLELMGQGLNQSQIAKELGRAQPNVNASIKDIAARVQRLKEKSA